MKDLVKAFDPADTDAVRRICFETALYGKPIRDLLDDRRLVTEALLGYYIRFEPESFFVAQTNGCVAGYLSGCTDTQRFRALYVKHIIPRILTRFFIAGHWMRRSAWRLITTSAAQARTWNASRTHVVDDYPAHLHINVDSRHRGRGLGSDILGAFLRQMARRHIPGIHLTTESEAGRRFFEKAGFAVHACYPIPSVVDKSRVNMWLMVKRVESEAP